MSGNSRRFSCLFSGTFFFGKEKINRFEFLIYYYSHLKDTEIFFFFLKKLNLLLFLWLFEVGASKKSAWVARVILGLKDI